MKQKVLVLRKSDFFPPAPAPRSFRRALEQEQREKRAIAPRRFLGEAWTSILDHASDAELEPLLRRSATEFCDAVLATRSALQRDRAAVKAWLR